VEISSLDSKLEEAGMNNIFKYYKDKSILLVVNRLTIIQDVDVIHELDGGEIIEQGNHMELMSLNGNI